MGDYWRADPDGLSFVMFAPAHLLSLAALLAVVAALVFARGALRRGGRLYRIVRYGLAAVLLLCEVSLDVWTVAAGEWTVRDSLPLQLCSLTLLLSVAMLLTRSYRLFQFVYFAGIGGALQALLTPDLAYGFPHFRFIEFMVAHIAIIGACLFMVFAEGYRLRFRSVGTAMMALNAVIVPVFVVNWVTGGNYMFLMRKPAGASLLDVLGPWPWYLLSLEAVAFATFLVLYAPFSLEAIWNKRRRPSF